MQFNIKPVSGKTVAIASLALGFVLVAGTAFASLTFNSTAITSDGALTLNPTGQPVTVNGDLTVNTNNQLTAGLKQDDSAFTSPLRNWWSGNGTVNIGTVNSSAGATGLIIQQQGNGYTAGAKIFALNTDNSPGSFSGADSINIDAGDKSSIDKPNARVLNVDASASNFGTGLVGETTEFYAGGSSSSGPVTNATGLHVAGHGQAGTVNAIGVWIDDQTGATNNYAIKTGLGQVSFGDAVTAPSVITTPVTVSALPTCNSGRQGAHAFVTDANATTFNTTVAGGGSNKLPVFCDGTNWKIGG
jgi:hypothetical protein